MLSSWVPPVDIFENEKKELVIKAELPDVRKEDVSVTVENNLLTLSGERKVDAEVKKEHYHHPERSFGSFSRSFSLPTTVDTGKIGADFKNGVLTCGCRSARRPSRARSTSTSRARASPAATGPAA